jgi:response regulator RpfG family c-di-GMP phosphodiesterase
MSNRILCVDDEANVLAAYQRNLRKQFSLDTALSGAEALRLTEDHGPYAVIVADMRMPEMDGAQLLAELKRRAPDTVRIMLTGNVDQHTAMEAVNKGHIFRFLTKPCAPATLAAALRAGLEQYRLVTAERDLLENTLNGSVRLLTDVLSLIDPLSFGRGQVLKDSIRAFARHLNVSETWDLEMAAMLSPIGCVTVPPPLLLKWRSGLPLSRPEKDLVLRVPELGARLLANIPRLESVSRIVLYQHKNFDGSGFPHDEIAGQDIPIGARILRVLADLDEMESKGKPRHTALEEMRQGQGCYDPAVINAAFASFDIYLPDASPAPKQDRAVFLKDLHPGGVLLADVKTRDDNLIVKAGTTVSPALLERLRNFARIAGVREPILARVPFSSPLSPGGNGCAEAPS